MSDTAAAGQGSAPSVPTPQSAEPSPQEVLAFDPFGPATSSEPKGSEKPGETGTPAEGEGGSQPGAQQQPGSSTTPTPATPATPGQQPPVPATPQAQPSPQPTMQELVAAIRQAAQPQQSGGQPQAQDQPRYNLQLPPQILSAMRSEDPAEFATGLHSVVNGIANKIWTDTQEFLAQQFLPQITQSIQANMQQYQQQQQVAQQFYGKHTALAAPNLRPLVQQAGLQVVAARQAAGKPLEWSPEVMDEIAEAVYATVPQLRPASPPPPPPANGKQPFATGQGSRPPSAGQKTAADELAEFVKG